MDIDEIIVCERIKIRFDENPDLFDRELKACFEGIQ
jgi:hypothetical protein